jgi:hypothetical protein
MSAQTRRALQFLKLHSIGRVAQSPTIVALLTTAALSSSAATFAVAEPSTNPGHALAQRFAEDTERARAAEAAKKEAAQKAGAQRRKQEAEKAAKAKRQKSLEDEMIERARAEAEERRQLEAEAARLDALRMAREAKDAEAARQAAAKREAEVARVIEEARKADEVKRAAEAARLAAERAAQEESRKAAEARRIAEEKELEARRIEAQRLAEVTRRAQNERLAEEGRRAEAERIEAARKAEEVARTAAEARRLEQAAEAKRAEQAAEARRAEQAAWAAEEAKRAEEAQREIKRATDEEMRRVGALESDAEIERVAARLRSIREQHMARHMRAEEREPATSAPATPALAPSTEPSSAPDGAIGRLGMIPSPATAPVATEVHKAANLVEQEYVARHNGRVTILLQMESSSMRGRRHESMDPILCVADGCYVSNGPHHPATFMPGRRATRFGNAISRRAGACNHSHTCVFRDVDIGALPAEVQPVDIRVLRHDRRTPETIETLSTCRGSEHRLACTGAIHGDGFTMWVIPESVAARLPVDVFGTTVESSLAREPHAAIAPPRGRW